MSTFPIFHNLNSGAGFPGLSSYSAEQISLAPMEQPLYDQKAADLAALDLIPADDWLKILGLQSPSAPGAYWTYVDSPPIAESDEVRNDFTAAIRTKVSHPRVAHACDYCRRRKTKCSGDQPVCAGCKKRGKVCQWTPIKTTKERRSRKPYDAGSEYRPRPSASASSAPSIAAPRATYPSVMLPNPMTIWSIEDASSAAQASTISNASSSRSEPSPTGWSPQYDSDCDVEWIPSPPSSCPSLGNASDDSSREPSPLDTPTRANSTPDSIYFSGEEPAAQNFDDIDDFFKDLYQSLSPEWSSVLQSWPEMPVAQ